MQLGIQNLLFAIQQVIGKKLSFHIFKTETLDGSGKTLAGLSLFTEEKNGLFNYI